MEEEQDPFVESPTTEEIYYCCTTQDFTFKGTELRSSGPDLA